mmetsp:Transcript_14047/g.12741  ORF Transcript_14047/g.12741 Transcript_14047/m.12741 type:complete len:482 (+) Transcript_14047:102-1547(+)
MYGYSNNNQSNSNNYYQQNSSAPPLSQSQHLPTLNNNNSGYKPPVGGTNISPLQALYGAPQNQPQSNNLPPVAIAVPVSNQSYQTNYNNNNHSPVYPSYNKPEPVNVAPAPVHVTPAPVYQQYNSPLSQTFSSNQPYNYQPSYNSQYNPPINPPTNQPINLQPNQGMSLIQQRLLSQNQNQSNHSTNQVTPDKPSSNSYANAIAGAALGVGALSVAAAVAITSEPGSSVVSTAATAVGVLANSATSFISSDAIHIFGKFGDIASRIPIFGVIGAMSAVIADLAREARYNQLAANLILTRIKQSNAILLEMFQDVYDPSPSLITLLETFKELLDRCQKLLERFSHRSYLSRLLRGYSDNIEITILDKSISDIISNIQLSLQIKNIKISQDTNNNLYNMRLQLENQKLKNDSSNPDGSVKADELVQISKEDIKKITEAYSIPMDDLNDEIRHMTSEIKASQDRIEADMQLIKKALNIRDNESK